MSKNYDDERIERPDPRLIKKARAFSAATLHEVVGRCSPLPSAIKPLSSGTTICGAAFTVLAAPRDNLWIHRALSVVQEGDILVVDVGGAYEAGYWGEVMTVAAQACGVEGLVINGCVRDYRQLVKSGFPVFCRGVSIRGTTKDVKAAGAVNVILALEGTIIAPGDVIVGDDDGVVAVPRSELVKAIHGSIERKSSEAAIMDRLRAGETTLDVYGWD